MTRVLIVDDTEANLYYLEALLRGHGYDTDAAHHGAEALTIARRSRPDLVVSDLLMPVMDGYTLLRKWKVDPGLKAIPFIVYTATYTQREDEQLALSLGADAFIVKPAEPEALLQRIEDVYAASVRSGPAAGEPAADESEVLKAYSEVLVRKLEEKMLQLEEANRVLQDDIAERIKAREELEQHAALFRIAGQVARIGGWKMSLPDRIVSWSDEACEIHEVPKGHTPSIEEVLGFCVPEQRDEVASTFEECARLGTPVDLEFEIVAAGGSRKWIRGIAEPVRGEGGAIVGLQGAVQDISDRKLLEQGYIRAQRMESIAALTSGMAHDLNNVLAPILLSLDLVRDEVRKPEVIESLSTIESCARRGTEMVEQVLSFARGIEGHGSGMDLAEILADLEKVVRETFPRSIAFRVEVPHDLRELPGDPTQIHQVFMNLFLNARDAMPDGGTLSVIAETIDVDEHYAAMSGTGLPGPHVRISVTDTGIGMSPEVLKRIFDPLFTTKPEGRGTGLGLSTVATILQNHHASVNVYSEPGEGTTFRLHFPAAVGDRPSMLDRATTDLWQGRGELILVVDDEAAVRSLTQQTLEAFGYRVITAADGADAIAIYESRAEKISAVITDLVMPVQDGPTMTRVLRELDPEVPIISASGIGSEEGGARAAEAGARYFLTKPYTADALLAVVSRALS
ncbi:MAG: response regulator [Gemmatimonadota bacterium]